MSQPGSGSPGDDGGAVPASIERFSGNDRVAAEQLAEAFRAIRDHHPDREVARCARQVLDGRRSVREVVREPEFQEAMSSGMSTFSARWDEMSDEERRGLLEQGRAARDETASDADEAGMEEWLTRRPQSRP